MSDKFRDQFLLVLMYICVGLAIVTALPGHSSRPNDLGYYSICSFAPWSTLVFLVAAGLLWVIRRYFQTRPQLQRID